MKVKEKTANDCLTEIIAKVNQKRRQKAEEEGKEFKPIDLTYNKEVAKRLRQEKEMELQEKINGAYLNFYKEQNKLKYSMIPPQYQEAEFTDLVISKNNEVLINHMVKYVKNFERMRKGVCLIGDYGIGKTRIIATTCKKLIELKDQQVYFATEQSILDEVKRIFNDDSKNEAKDVIRKICTYDVVVIDELGTTKSEWELGIIKRIIDGVINNNRRMFATTNYSGNELLERWGQSDTNKTPKQVLDRMNEAMDLYKIQGSSFRSI